MSAVDRVDGRVAVLAGAQGGVVGRGQALALGLTRDQVEHRCQIHAWQPLHRGVYAIGHGALGLRGVAIGALLAAGPRAVASHALAAALWGMSSEISERPHVTLPYKRRGSRTVSYHVGRLDSADVRGCDGLPVTSPERTILDCAETDVLEVVARMLREGRVTGRVREPRLRALLARARGRHGVAVVRALLDGGDAEPTRSETEEALRALLRGARVPEPVSNHHVAGLECDFVWRQERLIVETDAWGTHGDLRSFERDRARDAALTARGWTVLRFTRRQIRDQPLLVLAQIAQVLGARRAP